MPVKRKSTKRTKRSKMHKRKTLRRKTRRVRIMRGGDNEYIKTIKDFVDSNFSSDGRNVKDVEPTPQVVEAIKNLHTTNYDSLTRKDIEICVDLLEKLNILIRETDITESRDDAHVVDPHSMYTKMNINYKDIRTAINNLVHPSKKSSKRGWRDMDI